MTKRIESRLDDLERAIDPQGGFEVVIVDPDWTDAEREQHTAEARARVGENGILYTISRADPQGGQP